VPNDIDPEEPDRHSSARVVRLADTVSPAPDKPRRPPRKPRSEGAAKAAPRKKPAPAAAKAAPPDPGPPPPLPSDLELAASAAAGIVVPPRPPLPPTGDDPSAESASDAVQTSDPAAATEPPADVEAAPLADSAPGVDAEPVVESAPVAEPAAAVVPARVAEPEVVPAAEPEVVVEPDVAPDAALEPETALQPDTALEPDSAAEPEVAPDTALEPDAALEPVVAADSVVGAEPVAEPEAVPIATTLPEQEPAPLPVVLAPVLATAGATASLPIDAPPLPAAAGDALVLRGVTKRFGSTHAVDGIDLTIPAGTFYGLVGPNGAGKTTTLSMIAGLLEPDRGTIHVGGVDAAAHPLAAKKLMGVLPDRLRTFDRLTGRQLLYYYGVLRKLPPAIVESRTTDLARAFDLEDALGRSVSDYSAGMLKKVMLAGALIHSPRLLVLDEPFEAVDPVSSAIILDILSTYVAHGGTVILSSHGMDLVERVCTRVAVIVAGQVLAEGTVEEVRGELTLEQRFVELAGGLSDVEGLEWLHTFSD